MIDISSVGADLNVQNTQIGKATNILSTQLGSLEYAPGFGIDLRYFLQTDLKFQNESFKSYCLQVLSREGINVANILETVNRLYSNYIFDLSSEGNSTALVAR